MTYQTPSNRPADETTLAGLLKLAARKAQQGMESMLPVEVVSYDRATNRATVRHLVKMQGADGQLVDRANVSSVRVYQFGNAKFSMSLPIKQGDKGWLKASDRDISLFQQDLKDAAPNTTRMHSFQDGMFMPDAMSFGDAPAGQGDRVVIGNAAGGTFFSFDDDGFYFKVGGVSAELKGNGLILTSGGVRYELTEGGFRQFGGSMAHNDINVGDSHTHGGVETGGGSTTGPK